MAQRGALAATRAQVGFKAWIEQKAAPWAAGGMILGMVARSAQTYSFGAVNLAAMPRPMQLLYDIVTGLAIAAGMELLMGAAGAQWWKYLFQAIETEHDAKLSARERARRAKTLYTRSWAFAAFAAVGALASVGAGVYFAFSAISVATNTARALEIVTMVIITVGVFYFTVIHEPEQLDPLRDAQDAVQGQLYTSARAVAARIGDGTHTPADVQFLRAMAPTPELSRKLDALTPREENGDYWDTPRIARWLGAEGDEAVARDIRRRLSHAHQTAQALGVRRKESGRGFEAPHTAILALFQDEIERRMTATAGHSADTERRSDPGSSWVRVIGGGQAADMERRAVAANE